jgi:large subunit ribosomal protein L35
MPKQKTRRSAAKRFKITGSGKVRRRQAWRAHYKVGRKPSKRLRRLKGDAPVAAADEGRVNRMLGR